MGGKLDIRACHSCFIYNSTCWACPVDEGLYVQIMHLGSFDDEPATVALMDTYLEQNGYVNDINKNRLYYEIYMSDARKVTPEKWKTVIRHSIRKA